MTMATFLDDPVQSGLLQFGLAMMAGAGPSPQKQSLGSIVGKAGLVGTKAYKDQQEFLDELEQRKIRRKLLEMQTRKIEEDLNEERLIGEAAKAAYQTPTGEANMSAFEKTGLPLGRIENAAPQLEAMKTATGGVSPQSFLRESMLRGVNPLKAVLTAQGLNKLEPTQIVPPGAAVVRGGKPIFTNPIQEKAAADPSSYKEWVRAKEGGYTGSYVDFLERQRRASGTSVSVMNYEPASVSVQRNAMEAMVKNYDVLQNAPVMLKNLDEAKKLVSKAGGLVGQFADIKIAAIKTLNNNLGTNISPEEVSSAEQLRGRMFTQIIENLRKLDANPTERQQRMMMDGLGSIGSDPAAIPKLLDAYAESIRGKVSVHNKKVREAKANRIQFPYSLEVDIEPFNPTEGDPVKEELNRIRKLQGLPPL